MLKNYLKTAFRNFRNNKFYTFINIAGLAIGIATCLLIMLYVLDELSYDKYNKNANEIYRIDNEIKFGGNHFDLAVTAALEGPVAVQEIPEVLQYTRLRTYYGFVAKKGTENLRETKVAWADSTLFDVFTLPVLAGDPKTALKNPHSLVVTERFAKKYFNRVDVVGQNLVVRDTDNYKITAVIENIPEQSHFNFDAFIPLTQDDQSRDDNWFSENFNTYILVKKGTDPKKLTHEIDQLTDRRIAPMLKSILNESIDDFKKGGNFVRNSLTPLKEIHLHSNKIAEIGANSSIQYVYIFSGIAVLILLIACVNFMNLSTARSSNRAKEIGVRKVLGSLRKNLVYQFLTESLVISFIAFIFALLLVVLLLHYFNQLAGKNISITVLFNPSMLFAILSLMVAVGLLAGSYPALFLSAFQPIDVLKGKLAKGFKGTFLRNALVVVQFAISIVLIVGTTVIHNQLNYIRNKDVGFDRDKVIVIQNSRALRFQANAFKEELRKLSGIKDITMTGYLPVNGYRSNDAFFTSPALDQQSAISMQKWYVDENYMKTLGIKLVDGRNFSRELLTDSLGIIVNEAAVKFLATKEILNKKLYSLEDAKTKRLNEYHIIGVAKNFNYSSLREAISPLALCYGEEQGSMAIRLSSSNLTGVIDQIKNKWQSMATGEPFEYVFMDDQFNDQYNAEQRTGQIFITFAILAILIACLGLFGLSAFAAEQRTKEIGVRKVLGASVTNIAAMLSKEFFKLVIIASLIAFPIAWWAMNKWLQDFAYRSSIGWWIFAVAGLLVLFITLITVSFQAIKAALLNPVKSLRTE